MKQTFKEVAHHHMGCKILITAVDSGFREVAGTKVGEILTLTSVALMCLREGSCDFKPILFDTGLIDGLEMVDLMKIAKEYTIKPNSLYKIGAEQTAYLLKRHYNVFNLPSEEFIDATTMEGGNPYE